MSVIQAYVGPRTRNGRTTAQPQLSDMDIGLKGEIAGVLPCDNVIAWSAVDKATLDSMNTPTNNFWEHQYEIRHNRSVKDADPAASSTWPLPRGSEAEFNTECRFVRNEDHRTLQGSWVAVHRIAFSPDGRTIAVRCDKTDSEGQFKPDDVELWDAVTSELKRALGQVTCHSFSPDGKIIAIAVGKVASLWAVESGELHATLNGHTKDVLGVVFGPDGQKVATWSRDYTVRIWNPETGGCLATHMLGDACCATNVEFIHDKMLVATMAFHVMIWDLNTGQLKCTIDRMDVIRSSVVIPDISALVLIDRDNNFCTWDAATGKRKVTAPKVSNAAKLHGTIYNPHARVLAFVTEDPPEKGRDYSYSVMLWSVGETHITHLQTLPSHPRSGVSCSFDGTVFAYTAPDKKVMLWNMKTSKLVPLDVLTQDARTIALSPDGHMIAVEGMNGGRCCIDISAVLAPS